MKIQLHRSRSLAVAATISLLLGLFPFVIAQADETTATFAGTGGTLPLTGSDSIWTSTGNITAIGGVSAANLFNANDTSDYLRGSNFGFTIPDGSTIDGIELEIIKDWQCNALAICADDTVSDYRIQIVKADGTVGTEDKSTATPWLRLPLFELVSYGGAADLWSETWTAADINDADFGAVVAVQTSDASSKSGQVWFMTINVTFTLPTTTTVVACTTPVVIGDDSICTATVTPSAGSNVPSGDIDWTSAGGTFSAPSCTLVAGECSVTFTPGSIGTPLVMADYAGDANMTGSDGDFAIQVNPPPTTTTDVVCTTPVVIGDDSMCTATVTPSSGPNVPSGNVDWASADGTFSAPSCVLVAAACSVTFTPDSLGAALVMADYPGDANMTGSNGNFTIQVNSPQPVPVVSVPVMGPFGLLLSILGLGLLGGWQARRRC